MKTITGEVGAWLSSSRAGESPEVFENLSLSNCDMTDSGWVKVGSASVSVDLLSRNDVVNNQIEMLNEAEKRVKEDAQNKLNIIESQRKRLLAIEYRP